MGRSAALTRFESDQDMPDVADIFEILGHTATGNQITYTFGLIEIAEEEITKMRNEYPEKAEIINNAFQHLRWVLSEKATNEVFRSHAREILLRIVNGVDIKPGTNAECLIAMSNSSLRAPLNTLGLATMQRLFVKVYGKDFLPELNDIREPYPGACNELIAQLQKKLSNARTLG